MRTGRCSRTGRSATSCPARLRRRVRVAQGGARRGDRCCSNRGTGRREHVGSRAATGAVAGGGCGGASEFSIFIVFGTWIARIPTRRTAPPAAMIFWRFAFALRSTFLPSGCCPTADPDSAGAGVSGVGVVVVPVVSVVVAVVSVDGGRRRRRRRGRRGGRAGGRAAAVQVGTHGESAAATCRKPSSPSVKASLSIVNRRPFAFRRPLLTPTRPRTR